MSKIQYVLIAFLLIFFVGIYHMMSNTLSPDSIKSIEFIILGIATIFIIAFASYTNYTGKIPFADWFYYARVPQKKLNLAVKKVEILTWLLLVFGFLIACIDLLTGEFEGIYLATVVLVFPIIQLINALVNGQIFVKMSYFHRKDEDFLFCGSLGTYILGGLLAVVLILFTRIH